MASIAEHDFLRQQGFPDAPTDSRGGAAVRRVQAMSPPTRISVLPISSRFS
jgi:hypothetical protein